MDFIQILRIVQVVLGIGLVIFVHEAGHFIAARICKVQVEVFSLGFGPPLFSWKRRGTIYQIAAVPLGGFVKMLGDEPTQEGRAQARDFDETYLDDKETVLEKRDSELSSKSVGQRFFIYSGGVLMNMAFAVIVFPFLFAAGVPFTKPLIDPAPGGVAWRAGIQPGSTVESVNGREVFEFGHIGTSVALGDTKRVELMVRAPGEEQATRFVLKPENIERYGYFGIHVGVGTEPGASLRISEGSAAWDAGLRTGMRLVDVEGASTALPPLRQVRVREQFGAEIVLNVLDDGEPRTFRVQPDLTTESPRPRLGVHPLRNFILAIRDNPDLEALGLEAEDKVLEVSGHPIYRDGDLAEALIESTEPITFQVDRADNLKRLAMPAGSGEFTRARRLKLFNDIAIGRDFGSTSVAVALGEAGYEAGLRDGDRITHINDRKVENWTAVYDALGEAGTSGSLVGLKIHRTAGDAPGYLELTAQLRTGTLPAYGIFLSQPEYIYQSAGMAEAIRVGIDCSIRFIEDTWLTLKGMVFKSVSTKNMGGIIMISQVSYSVSQQGLAKLLFFLCMLSINLAILNVLPIPVLDGGHLFFLLIEKLKGSPVSDRVLGYSQMVGLVLILSLMVYVTFNDIQRFFL